jgi:hypothetical protein
MELLHQTTTFILALAALVGAISLLKLHALHLADSVTQRTFGAVAL